MRDCDTLTKILDVRTGTAALQWLQCDRQTAAATAVGATLSRLLIERTNTTTRRTYARRQPLDTINRGPRWRHRLTDNMHFWSDGSNWRGCFARTAWNLKTVIFSQRLKLLTTIDSEVGIMTKKMECEISQKLLVAQTWITSVGLLAQATCLKPTIHQILYNFMTSSREIASFTNTRLSHNKSERASGGDEN